ncbi:MAG: hypothetical protein ABI818_20525 [Acidobacteriota bacterium]
MFLGHIALAAKRATPSVAAAFGPPPPNAHALALSALAMFLLIPWMWWADRTTR